MNIALEDTDAAVPRGTNDDNEELSSKITIQTSS